jgi:hypothetical protein
MATLSGRSSLNGDMPVNGDNEGRWGASRGKAAAAAASLFWRCSCLRRLPPMPLTFRNMLPDFFLVTGASCCTCTTTLVGRGGALASAV